MSWSFRRVRLVLAAVTLLTSTALVQEASAQAKMRMKAVVVPAAVPAPEGPAGLRGGSESDGLSLLKDERGLKDKIKAAVDYIEEKNWAIAIPHLQKIVDLPSDVLVNLPRKNPDGKETFAWTSARIEANRLIATLPKAGLEFYKLTYGAESLALLKKAKASGDPALLAEVMKRFAHTDAGAEAIVLLARYQLDRGNSVPASLCFQKLLSREDADQLPGPVLFYMAVAFHLAGDRDGEKLAWERLKSQNRDITLGKETRSVADLEDYVASLKNSTTTQDASDCQVYRGTLSRSNQLAGGPAFLEERWKQPMIHADNTKTTTQRITQAEQILHRDQNQAVLPAFFPVTATVLKDGQRLPLLLYKSFWGIHAVNMRNGKLEWDAPSTWSIERILDSRDNRKTQTLNHWLNTYIDTRIRPQILFENSTYGTLSTDNEFVYAIDDFLIPPPASVPQMGFPPGGFQQGVGATQEMTEAMHFNRLQAYDLQKGGKLSWEVGSYGEKDELSDTFFLGPPLPLGGKLYVLTEKQQELRLVCLDPHARGKVLSIQTLGTAAANYSQEPTSRRSQAVHLAYSDGILVVPTNTGAVFGINLLENSVVWACFYRDVDETPVAAEPAAGPFPGGRRVPVPAGVVAVGPDGQPLVRTNVHQWKTSAPAIFDGKVVFTAPDQKARSVRCISLRDGTPVWTHRRMDDDLYFAGVFAGKALIVGKRKCRALNLNNGEVAWDLDTGQPSGQGVASGNVYYLPLGEAGKDKEPEICAIDVARGAIVAHTHSRKHEVPGNLLFYEGDVVSQSHKEVVAYPQLKVKIAQMDELIAKNPNDPKGLSERGDYRLDQGDLPGAIDDLQKALRNKPTDEDRVRIRSKLYEALTEYVHWKFNEAEEFLPLYEELCKVDQSGLTEEAQRNAAAAEERKRRSTFLCLVAEGRRNQGKLVEAFEKYQQFAEVARADELTSSMDERGVRANPDVWARGRISAMVAAATPEQRKPLEDLIASRWDKLQSGAGSVEELRQFVRLFGTLSPAGREARFRLVERLVDSKEPTALLEAERELLLLRSPRESPEIAGRAVEALARLYTRRGLLEDAAYCYRMLGSDFAHVKVRDGKTGADLFDEAATDKRLMPHLDEVPMGPIGRVIKAVEEPGVMPHFQNLYRFERIGEPLPYFRRFEVALTYSGQQKFSLIDRNTGKEFWGKPVSETHFLSLTHGSGAPNAPRFACRTMGHLVVLPAGHMVFGIDPISQQVLWEKNLTPASAIAPANGQPWQSLTIDPKDGTLLVTHHDGFAQRIGQTGSLESNVVCVQTKEALEALDPLTGKTLWQRTDVAPRASLFADDQHIFVVESATDGTPTASRVFRAADGVAVKAQGFASAYAKRLHTFGHDLLISEPSPTGTLTLRLYDILEGKDLWSQTFPAKSVTLTSEDPSLTGAIEPDGKVHVLDARTGKAVLVTDKGYDYENPRTGVEPGSLANSPTITLLADARFLYLAFQAQPDMNVVRFGPVQSQLMASQGLRAVPLNGRLYAYERGSGKFAWPVEAANQTIMVERFAEMPILVLTSRYSKMPNAPGRFGNVQQVMAIQTIDKRTGKTLYLSKDEGNNQVLAFHEVRLDTRAGKVELISQMKSIVHYLHGEMAGGMGSTGEPQQGPVGSRSVPGKMLPVDVPQVEIKK
jgi:outer membrane protein assembly factor BamB/tetratricopeptide (TPR) repeat protein